MQITYLADTPECIAVCAKWAFEAWGKYNPASTTEKRTESFRQHCNKDKIPLTLLAWIDGKLAGMASLRVNDGIRQDLTPWLGSLYVDTGFRSQGIGEELIAAIKEEARRLEYTQLYLLTYEKTLPQWYAALGWESLGSDTLFDNPVTVMTSSLA